MTEYNKPLPQPTEESLDFWEGCKRHELLIQRCKDCGAYIHYPRAMCPKCNSFDLEYTKVSGKGEIYTWAVAHRAFHLGFANDVPYATIVVELDEGVRLMSNIVDCKPEDLYIGMPVEVVFDDVTEEVTLPKFRPVE